ncbi:extracellular solute-binding protein [Paenibacillus sedimenti]|uniref:Extracellular solute-binding protein n=1 Tax=Paenibacillus sedimenti TaxID=2770274 RepID=A0A926KWL7_9BACL|nr:extracellular solute-binding protein [Paenibacillus sedimenti]MBD0384496.1 extracellular solute-binding protein [Paenibacillus sedimenti]
MGIWLYSAGGSILEMDSPQAIKALEFLTGLIQDGAMSKEVINWTQADVMKQFTAGKAAMIVNGPWQIPEIRSIAPDLKFELALIPRDQKFASVLGGENLAVIKGKKEDAAVQFLAYFANPGVMKPFSESFGNFPPRKDVAAYPSWTNDPHLRVFSKEMDYVHVRPPIPHWPGISNAISTALVKSLSHSSTPAESSAEAQIIIERLQKVNGDAPAVAHSP